MHSSSVEYAPTARGSAPGRYDAGVPAIVEMPVLPASYNTTRFAPWYVAHAENKKLMEAIGWALRMSNLPRRVESVTACAELRFPSRRRRDEGNFRTPLEKALGDSLVQLQYLPDDTPDRFRFDRLVFLPDTGAACTTMILEWRQ